MKRRSFLTALLGFPFFVARLASPYLVKLKYTWLPNNLLYEVRIFSDGSKMGRLVEKIDMRAVNWLNRS